MSETQSAVLARFAATLQYEDIPAEVVERAKNLYADWVGSALAGKGGRPVEALAAFARRMAPASGPCEVLISRERTTPYFAAFINGASSHYAEQDDVHNGSVFHPAAVVFPAVLAVAQEAGACGKDFITAAIVGYEVGIRVGEFLGRSHYRVFHTTGTAGTLAAAAAAGRLLGLTPAQMLDAFGSAGTQAAGLWEFLADAADSKQLHTAKAAADGMMSPSLPGTASRAQSVSWKGRAAWLPACPPMPMPRSWSTASAHAGPWSRRPSNTMPRAVTRTPPRMRWRGCWQTTRFSRPISARW